MMGKPNSHKWETMQPFWKARIKTGMYLTIVYIIAIIARTHVNDRLHDIKWIISSAGLFFGILFFLIEAVALEGEDRAAHRCYAVRYHFSTIITTIYTLLALWPLSVSVLKTIPLYQYLSRLSFFGCNVGEIINRSCAYQLDSHIALVWAVMYSLDLCFFQYRWTYRVLPCIFTSSSFFIMFMMVISSTTGNNGILGFGIMNPERIAPFTSNTFTKWLGWSLIGTILATFASKATEDLWHGFSRNTTGDFAKVNYRFKLQRRRLLTYQARLITRIGVLQILYTFIVIGVGGLLLLTKEGIIRQFLGQIYFIGIALAILGFSLHQFITDSNLLRAENAYIKDRIEAAENSWTTNKKYPCREATWEWMCYCQTLANIYCSRSPIFYENSANHNTELLIPHSKDHGTNSICQTRIVSDLVYVFEEQFSLYCCEEAKTEQREIELQFADSLMRYIDDVTDESYVSDFDDNTFILEILTQMNNAFYASVKGRLSIVGYPEESVKSLLLLDYIKRFLYYKEKDTAGHTVCRLYWLCKGELLPEEVFKRREEAEKLRQLFPYEMLELLLSRWKKDSIVFNSKSTFGQICQQIICDYNSSWGNNNSVWVTLDDKKTQEISNQIERYKALLLQ